jgi:hypothetical protein
LCQLDAGVAEVVRWLAELRKAVSPLRSATALQMGDLGRSRPRLPEAQAPRVHGNLLDTLSGRAALRKPLQWSGACVRSSEFVLLADPAGGAPQG